MKKIIGIDLGTTNSCMSFIRENKPIMIPNYEGKILTPSVVAFTNDNQVLVGDSAQRQSLLNPESTISSVKRLMGKKYFDIEHIVSTVPYKIQKTPNDFIEIKINENLYTPQEISAFILQKLKFDAEQYLDEEIKEAVITVPARFGKAEIKATQEAGEIAGLQVKRLIAEPTSACLAYGLNKPEKENYLISIFDLGGGSLDVSILDIEDGVFEVISTFGDLNLGGDNFDYKIVDWLMNAFKQQNGVDLSKNARVIHRFKEVAEKAKIELSESLTTPIFIPFIPMGTTIKDFSTTFSRDEFKLGCSDLIERCIKVSKKAIFKSDTENRYSLYDFKYKELIFVGGSTRIPFLREEITKTFKIESNKKINPDEVVAQGAAVQGGILTGEVKDKLLLDITAYKYGVKIINNDSLKFCPIIEDDRTIPEKKKKSFHVIKDNKFLKSNENIEKFNYLFTKSWIKQSTNNYKVEINIFESDGIFEKNIGVLAIDIQNYSNDEGKAIEIIFEIDADSILEIRALGDGDILVGKKRISAETGLTEPDLIKKTKEFEKHYFSKKEFLRNSETLNTSEVSLNTSKDQLLKFNKFISSENKKKILELNENLHHFIEKKDIQHILEAKINLEKIWQMVSQEIYLNQSENTFSSLDKPVQIFISYSHKDESFKNKLLNSLSPLKRQKLIDVWNDREIIPGTLWEENGIYKNLESAQIILLLVSNDFIASDYCYDKEIKKALLRFEKNEVLVIPIIIRPTRWQNLEIGNLQGLPTDGKAVSKWDNEDEAWENIIIGIEKAIDYIQKGQLNVPSH